MRRAVILAVIGFVLVMIVQLPARWLTPLLPKGIRCAQLDGSAWSGTCSGLATPMGLLGDVRWDLLPLDLLRGRLGLRLDLTQQGSFVRGTVDLGLHGALSGRDLVLDLPLTSALVSSLPAGTHAHLLGTLKRIEWTGKFLSVLEGSINLQDLIGTQGVVLGNYQAEFPAVSTDTPSGTVHDAGGPLALEATLQLTHDPGYLLQGEVAARPDAAPDLVDELKYLGSPDAAGRRPFSLAGTF